jgi:putative Mg2+ transporter-C (MgtC) family protein
MLTLSDIALRLGAAFLAAMVIGLERESHGRAAGLRTTLLAALAAAAAMILSEMVFSEVTTDGASTWRPDPARLAAGVLTGMGFLGAGAIIKDGNNVRGVTTAATLWSVSILGLIFGAGAFLLGGILWLLLVLTLVVLPRLEHLVKNDWYGWVDVRCAIDGASDADIRAALERHGVRVKRVGLTYDFEKQERRLRLELKFKSAPLYELAREVLDDLRTLPGVRELRWE